VRLARHTRRGCAGLLTVAVTALAAGCGSRDETNLVAGKTLFVGKCASCHTLARANARGVQGPNLDDAFRTARKDGFGKDTIEGVVRHQIAYPRRGGIMPAKLVTGQHASDVAAYVALVAGRGGKDVGTLATAGQPKTSNKPVKEQGGQIKLNADPTGALAFNTTKAIGSGGALKLVMTNEAQIQHNIAIKGPGVSAKGPIVGKGATSTVSANLKPGSYTFFCSVPGHEAGGMKGTLTVR
jgi:mono/diheme cytochrome c family protein